MKALTDEESDATELKLPSYIHGILKTECWAGTIRPDKDSARVSINVPAERRIDQSLLEIRYSPSLALAMVDALPYLAEYPYGCTEQTLNRFLPSVITQKVLSGMKLNLAEIRDKRTNLNAQEIGDDRDRARQWQRFDRNPVFDEAELAHIVKAGVKALTEQQISDGGWGWFSGIGERSLSAHHRRRRPRPAARPGQRRGPRPRRARKRHRVAQALPGRAAHAAQELRSQPPRTIRAKQFCDALDAFVYMVLVDAGADNVEMRDRLYRDRVQLPVYAKAMFGLALDKLGDKEKLDDDRPQHRPVPRARRRERNGLSRSCPKTTGGGSGTAARSKPTPTTSSCSRAREPKGEKAPRLVKYLLNNRKHATYWNSTRDTAICVEAFADYLHAAGETEPDMTVEVWLDGQKLKEVAINKDNLFTYDNKFVLAGADVKSGPHEIELRRRGNGPVYFNAYLTNFTLEDHITKAGLEVKVERAILQARPGR